MVVGDTHGCLEWVCGGLSWGLMAWRRGLYLAVAAYLLLRVGGFFLAPVTTYRRARALCATLTWAHCGLFGLLACASWPGYACYAAFLLPALAFHVCGVWRACVWAH